MSLFICYIYRLEKYRVRFCLVRYIFKHKLSRHKVKHLQLQKNFSSSTGEESEAEFSNKDSWIENRVSVFTCVQMISLTGFEAWALNRKREAFQYQPVGFNKNFILTDYLLDDQRFKSELTRFE